MLIGYFIDNEYDFHKFYSHVPKLKASQAAIKGRLVKRLKDKYQDINKFNSHWGTSFQSFEDLKEAELPIKTSACLAAIWTHFLGIIWIRSSERFRRSTANMIRIIFFSETAG